MQKGLAKKHPPNTSGTRVSCETGTGLGGQRVKVDVGLYICTWGEMGIGLDRVQLDFVHPMQIPTSCSIYICAGCRKLHTVHSVQLNSV